MNNAYKYYPYLIVFFWALITYLYNVQLATLFALGLGSSTTMFSMGFRAFELAVLLIFILWQSHFGLSFRKFPGFSKLLRLFWFFYGCRILFHFYTVPADEMMLTPAMYLGYGAISLLGLIFCSRPFQNKEEEVFARNTVLYVCALACLLIFISQRNYLGESYRTVANSLSKSDVYIYGGMEMGYIGAALVVLSFSGLIFRTVNLWIGIVFFILGGTLLVAGGTRGPILAAVFSIVFSIVFIQWKDKKRIWILLIGLSLAGAMVVCVGAGGELVKRFNLLGEQIQSGATNIGSGRGDLYRQAISDFIHNPIFGSGLEVRANYMLGYCHNSILEAFISTGVLGGMIFIAIIIQAFRDSIWILRNSKGLAWLVCLFLMTFIGSLFSGSLYGATIMWPCIAALRANVKENK